MSGEPCVGCPFHPDPQKRMRLEGSFPDLLAHVESGQDFQCHKFIGPGLSQKAQMELAERATRDQAVGKATWQTTFPVTKPCTGARLHRIARRLS